MIRKITRERPLKILGFTDTHLDENEACCRLTLELLQKTVKMEQPDLLVFVGDNVTAGYNEGRARAFTELMTELGIPWCPILGNHEGDNPYSIKRDEMARIFRQSPYCMVPEERMALPDGSVVFGDTTYTVPLYNEAGEICHRLIFLDCGTDVSEDVYICPKKNQVVWYREQVRRDTCPSMVFCHIPLPEFKEAYEKGQLLFGDNRERVSCAEGSSSMFEAILEERKTVAYIVGHDHVNDSRIQYKGVYLNYNRMSGISSYNALSKRVSDTILQGCSIYYIDAEGRVSYDDVFYEERYPQYRDRIYAIIRR